MGDDRKNFKVIDCLADHQFTLNSINRIASTNKNAADVESLEISPTNRLTGETGNVVETVQDKMLIAILSAMYNNMESKMNLAVKSWNAFSGQHVFCKC